MAAAGSGGKANTSNGARVPPHDVDTEAALLGSVLVWGTDRSIDALRVVVPEDFYVPAHANVAAALLDLADGGDPLDPLTVADRLRRDGLLDALVVDGATGLAGLVVMQSRGCDPNTARNYAERVRRDHRRRRLLAAAAELADAAYAGAGEDKAMTLLEEARVVDVSDEAMFEDLAPVLRHEEPAVKPNLLHRSDGMAFLYPGLLHWVYGEPTAGKTMFALLAALSTVRRGQHIAYLDYEGSRAIVGDRLESFGAAHHEVGGFRYRRPSVTSGPLGAEMARVIDGEGIVLVVIDGCAKALAHEGIDEDKAAPVLAWIERLIAPMTAAGAAVVVLDHVVKDKDGQGRWPRGTGAKLGEVDGAAYRLDARRPFSRSTPGYSAVVVGKDREGVIGALDETVGIMRVEPDSERFVWLDPPPDTRTGEPGTAGDAREAVMAVIGELLTGQEINQRDLEDRVRKYGRFRHDVIRTAAESLALEGQVSVRSGARRARLWSPGEAADPVLGEEF